MDMIPDNYIRLPRLYVDHELAADGTIPLEAGQAHYLRAVLRRAPGAAVRLFNGRDGEWLATLSALGKKDGAAAAEHCLAPQPAPERAVHLFFAPLKKARMDMLVEKAVELGATHLHPVLTRNTENRAPPEDRLRQQVIEAAEQCERLTLPALSPVRLLDAALDAVPPDLPVFAGLERRPGLPFLPAALPPPDAPCAVLIGPEGGFTAAEADSLTARTALTPVSLGPAILRSETAALFALSLIRGQKQDF